MKSPRALVPIVIGLLLLGGWEWFVRSGRVDDVLVLRSLTIPVLSVEFDAVVRIDTPGEADYFRNGGILQYVLRSLVA